MEVRARAAGLRDGAEAVLPGSPIYAPAAGRGTAVVFPCLDRAVIETIFTALP